MNDLMHKFQATEGKVSDALDTISDIPSTSSGHRITQLQATKDQLEHDFQAISDQLQLMQFDPDPVLVWSAGLPDEYQVFEDLAKGVAAAKQKDSGDATAGFKMFLQVPRHGAPVAGDEDITLSLDPLQNFRIGGPQCWSHVIAHNQDLYLGLTPQ